MREAEERLRLAQEEARLEEERSAAKEDTQAAFAVISDLDNALKAFQGALGLGDVSYRSN